MKLVSRAVAFFLLILFLFLVIVGIHEYIEAKDEEKLREDLEQSYLIILEKYLVMKQMPVIKYLQDITIWDETVKFLKNRNRRFLVDNIDSSNNVFDIGETWIYTSDFKKIYYYNNSNIATKAGDFDSALPSVISRFREEKFFSFFYRKGENLFEITAASIHPTRDNGRKTEPAGYIFTAIPYDRKRIDLLKSESPLITDVHIDSSHSEPPCISDTLIIAKTLKDINGEDIATLHVIIYSRYLQNLHSDERLKRLFLLFLFIILLVSAMGFRNEILTPVDEIYKILYRHDYTPFPGRLKHIPPEFQRIMDLVDINKSVELQLGEALRETEINKNIAEKATKAKSEFLANMTHEIRTPMAGVIGFTDMLLDVTIDPVQKELATGIKSSATTILDIINDILDMSKIESGKFVLLEEPFNINGFLDNFVWLLRGFASDRDLDIRLENRIAHCTTVTGDAKRLKQILLNLGSNAIKFTVDGEVLLTAESAPAGEGAVEITIAVSDTGIGMNEEQMSRIFRQYEQVHDPATFSGGTGLGLAITKSLVTVMGGTLDVRSEPGKGSTFTLKLRMKCTQGEDIKPSLINARNLGLEILIAEDNPISMRVIGNIIGKTGCSYEPAFNGQDVIELADSKKFDLILMDFHMPVISGIEAALKIRSGTGPNKDTPIYGISADLAERAMEKTGVSMMNGFLMKPFIIEDVYKVLMKVRGEKA